MGFNRMSARIDNEAPRDTPRCAFYTKHAVTTPSVHNKSTFFSSVPSPFGRTQLRFLEKKVGTGVTGCDMSHPATIEASQ